MSSFSFPSKFAVLCINTPRHFYQQLTYSFCRVCSKCSVWAAFRRWGNPGWEECSGEDKKKQCKWSKQDSLHQSMKIFSVKWESKVIVNISQTGLYGGIEPGTNCISTPFFKLTEYLIKSKRINWSYTGHLWCWNPIWPRFYQGGDNQLWLLWSSWIQNRVFYLVFTVVASEPDLSKVQQQHLLWA